MNIQWLIDLLMPEQKPTIVYETVEVIIEVPEVNLLTLFMKFYGIIESLDGIVLKWIRSFFPEANNASKVAWCAILINVLCKLGGYEHTGTAVARDFLKIGVPIELKDIQPGDIMIFSRGSSNWEGHVAIYVNDINNRYYCAGGNQNNQANIRKQDMSKYLGTRRMQKVSDSLISIPNEVKLLINL